MPLPLTNYIDLALLLLRLMAAIVFGSSGWSHVTDPEKRSQSIGMSKGFTICLGLAELAGAAGLAAGVLVQFAAGGLILVMLGAIYKKVVEWKTGFWGKDGLGWHYDLILIVINLVILTTNGGSYVLWK